MVSEQRKNVNGKWKLHPGRHGHHERPATQATRQDVDERGNDGNEPRQPGHEPRHDGNEYGKQYEASPPSSQAWILSACMISRKSLSNL